MLDEVDARFACICHRSLLTQLSVAALHVDKHKIIQKAIKIHLMEHCSSMLLLERAAMLLCKDPTKGLHPKDPTMFSLLKTTLIYITIVSGVQQRIIKLNCMKK